MSDNTRTALRLPVSPRLLAAFAEVAHAQAAHPRDALAYTNDLALGFLGAFAIFCSTLLVAVTGYTFLIISTFASALCMIPLFIKIINPPQKPRELLDGRRQVIDELCDLITGWDKEVRLSARLTSQVELGLIPTVDLGELNAKLQEDEKEILQLVEYANLLLEEGPLGSQEEDEGPKLIVEQMERRMELVNKHRDERRELAQRLTATVEVNRAR